MIADRKFVIFDTNGFNRLLDDPNQEEVLKKLVATYRLRIIETSVFELSKTKSSDRRSKLINLCKRLLPDSEYLSAHQFIIEEMARLYKRYRERFEWRHVDVHSEELEREIKEGKILAQDTVAEESRQFAKTAEDDFRKIFREALQKFNHDFTDGSKALSLAQLMAIYKAEGGPFWKTVAGFFERATLTPLPEKESRRFIDRCPPFHAITVGTVIAHYQYGIPKEQKASYDAGFFDLLMSIYLPYCSLFVTDDRGSSNAMKAIVRIPRQGERDSGANVKSVPG